MPCADASQRANRDGARGVDAASASDEATCVARQVLMAKRVLMPTEATGATFPQPKQRRMTNVGVPATASMSPARACAPAPARSAAAMSEDAHSCADLQQRKSVMQANRRRYWAAQAIHVAMQRGKHVDDYVSYRSGRPTISKAKEFYTTLVLDSGLRQPATWHDGMPEMCVECFCQRVRKMKEVT